MASIACQHHVSWIVEVEPGVHQCIQCFEAVEKKQITPKFDEMPEAFRRRWDAFEHGEVPALKH
jgi:hypothetical protein